MQDIKGTGVALVTPFKGNGEVDFDSLAKLIEHVISGGVSYLVALGTTSEAATLTPQERQNVLSFIVKANNGRLPIVVGIGGNNTLSVVNDINSYDLTGVCAILSASPYYNKPNQEGIFQHYSYIAEKSPLPIILYNVPGRTGSNMSANTTLRLAKKYPEKIVAIKEACGNLGQVSYILRDAPKGFSVISGDDNQTLAMIALGAEGTISVSANALPREVSICVNSAMAGELSEAKEQYYKLLEFQDVIFEEGNPTGIKSALTHLKVIENNLRLPLVKSTQELDNKLKNILKNIV